MIMYEALTFAEALITDIFRGGVKAFQYLTGDIGVGK